MHHSIKLAVVIAFLTVKTTSADDKYWQDRAALVQQEQSLSIGAGIPLSSKEQAVNSYLMSLKHNECSLGFNDPSKFLAAQHIFFSKPQIEQSAVFDLIRKLPKGAILHTHDVAMVSEEFVYNLTYKANLYACTGGNLQLKFFHPKLVSDDCDWTLVSDLRKTNASFDGYLREQISLVCDNPSEAYPSINPAWSKFANIFTTIFGMLTYRPVFVEYFKQALKELADDNVRHVELRSVLPEVYDLDGRTYNETEVVNIYKEAVAEFQKSEPNRIWGVKLIYAPMRDVNNKTFEHYLPVMEELSVKHSDFVAGFDIVGQEDLGEPLASFIPSLLKLKEKGVEFFFHAAETNWKGMATDSNLYDAILLNTTRIGHGYGILRHPKLMDEVKSRQIALEVSPISNQVLKLVDDFRNHPGGYFISAGFPVVITNDDPGLWGVRGLSYDWYVAFMGMAGCESDLRLLKQLAMNSILYSALKNEEKHDFLNRWQIEWNDFLNDVLIKNKQNVRERNVV